MSGGSTVDWDLAGKVARTVAGGQRATLSLGDAEIRRIGERTLSDVLAYTGLEPREATPQPRLVDRYTWIAANLEDLRGLAEPLERMIAGGGSLPGPLAALGRNVLGAAAGMEAGVAVGYAARRVVGQLRVALDGSDRPPGLMIVSANARSVAEQIGAGETRFVEWVLLHEQTHAVQFAAVPWLRKHLSGLLREVIEAASADIDLMRIAGGLKRLILRDPREALGKALRGELARALAGPQQADLLDRIQATMSILEGYAEHVMDAASATDAELAAMRANLDARRARTGLGAVIARVLGLGMKLEQYERGKRFCDAVTERAGIGGLNRVWEAPQALPTLAELDQPEAWLERAGVAA
ncbi:MAG TPA: zinc-dependent metalloprotease [Solirubrobacterales bacterium]